MNIQPIDYSEHLSVTLEYTSHYYYRPQLINKDDGWSLTFTRTAFDQPFHKQLETAVFDPDFPELKAYSLMIADQQAGLITLVHEQWSNRLRINDLHVSSSHQAQGYGSQLITFAAQQAERIGARAMILETQTSNDPAITFYKKHGFQLIGFDALAYTNDDIDRYETRLELGIKAPFTAILSSR